MSRLVAIDAAGTPDFPSRLLRVWEAGDAALPVDPRLPAAARDRLVAAMDAGGPVEPGDALVVATSGTTGAPKGVVLTHAALDAHARAVETFLHAGGADPHHGWLACLPLAHLGGLGVVVRALLLGRHLIVQPGFDPGAAIAAAREASLPLAVSLVATALQRVDATAFHRIVLGGGPAPPTVPPNAHVTYGMTETGGGVVYDGHPLPGIEVRADGGGELHVRGPTLLRTYRHGPDPKDQDGWLATGDLGQVGEDGLVQVAGRRGDLIITGGENVWPAPVEEALRRHPGVADVAVCGRPDPEWGQRVVAVVVAAPGTAPTLDALRSVVKAELPAFCAPRELLLVPALPRTALGKVVRPRLKADKHDEVVTEGREKG